MQPNLQLKDRKILSELEMNARIQHSQLAKKVGLSKQVVKYRIENLEKQNLIQDYNAIIDLSKLGKTIYVIYLKLIKMSSLKEKQWINELNKDKEIIAVGKNAGHWDLTIVIASENNQKLDEILKKILQGKTDKIKEKLITSEIQSSYFNMDLIHNSKDSEFKTSNSQEQIKLDEKDKQLISHLAKNCRINLIDLSEKLKMSPNGIKHKIQQLENKKIIIGYKTKINHEKLGYLHFRVFLHLNKSNKEINNKIKNFLKQKGNIESVSRYIGYADIDFRCYSKSLEEFYKLISEIKDKFLNEIIEVNSMPIFSWKKIEFY